MKKIIFLLFALTSIIITSCSSNDVEEAQKRSDFTQIVEKKSASDAMNELYIASDGDIEALARILHTTPSVIERIRKGESSPTIEFEDNYKEVLVYYNVNDRSFSKLRSALDDKYSWYDSVLNFPSHHPYWFWIGNIVLLILFLIDFAFSLYPPLLEILIFLVAWISMLIFSPSPMQDNYKDCINPTLEQKI